MKRLFVIGFMLFSSPLMSEVKLPKSEEFFKNETLVQSFKTKDGEVRMLSTSKKFDTLKAELTKFLGEGWKTELPKNEDQIDENKRKHLRFSKDTFVILVHPENPKLKVTLALTDLPGKEKGEFTAILTLIKNVKK